MNITDTDALDPLDPTVWNLLMLNGIVGLQNGNNYAAGVYLRFVVKHRDREVADRESLALRRLAKSSAYANAAHMIDKLVNPDAPKPASKAKAAPKAKKRAWSTPAGNAGRPGAR